MSFQRPQAGSMFELEFPQSVGIFNSYADAQKAVDYLADEKFAVQNLAIVGTDLKSVERVLGRRSWRTVLSSGVSSGVSTGLIVGIIMLIFTRPASVLVLILSCLALGVAIGLAFAAAGYAMTKGKRDFTSVTQTVATKYEVLCEHKVAAQAREMLHQLPGRPRRRLRVEEFCTGIAARHVVFGAEGDQVRSRAGAAAGRPGRRPPRSRPAGSRRSPR